MAINALLERPPQWLTEPGSDADIALFSQCTLIRNLSDFPFPARCSEEEKRAIEERLVGIMDGLGLFSRGQYYSLPVLEPHEARFLAERRLITYDLFAARGPRGVYVSEDQTFSIMINGTDHLCMRVILSGLQLQEAWAKLNLIDDTLSDMLDFAFNERLGFLSSDLGCVGTGLKASVLLHLPALTQTGELSGQAAQTANEHVCLRGVTTGSGIEARAVATPDYLLNQTLFTDADGAIACALNESSGSLYLLVNANTLGISEEENIFHVRHLAANVLSAERAARAALMADSRRGIEDLVGRARGVAGGARLLEFSEALELLSALRLGADTRQLLDITPNQLNELMLTAQGAHLALTGGHEDSPLTLSMYRADLFRGVFGN